MQSREPMVCVCVCMCAYVCVCTFVCMRLCLRWYNRGVSKLRWYNRGVSKHSLLEPEATAVMIPRSLVHYLVIGLYRFGTHRFGHRLFVELIERTELARAQRDSNRGRLECNREN